MTEAAYRYTGSGCPEHPGCIRLRCAHFGCPNLVHCWIQPGQPRRYCSAACRGRRAPSTAQLRLFANKLGNEVIA